MESIVKKYKSEIGVEEDNDKSYIEKKEELINAFGNKKSKTIIRKQNENKVDENNTFGKHIVSKIIKKQVFIIYILGKNYERKNYTKKIRRY